MPWLAYWLDHESEVNACGTDGIYRQLGADYGPFEWGLDRYACRNGNLLEWYPNPHYQFGTAQVFQDGSPPSAHDERLYTWMPGLYEVDPDYDETLPATPPARPMTLLTSTEVVEGCAVASQRDFHDNALRCWADASVAGLPISRSSRTSSCSTASSGWPARTGAAASGATISRAGIGRSS